MGEVNQKTMIKTLKFIHILRGIVDQGFILSKTHALV